MIFEFKKIPTVKHLAKILQEKTINVVFLSHQKIKILKYSFQQFTLISIVGSILYITLLFPGSRRGTYDRQSLTFVCRCRDKSY